MSCQNYEQQHYDEYLLGLADPQEESVISKHVESGCGRCTRSLSKGSQLWLGYALIADPTPFVPDNPHLRHRILASVQQLESLTRFERMAGLLADTNLSDRSVRSAAFLALWRDLASEMRAARNARRRGMFATRNWDFSELLRTDLAFARILAGLRWMLVRYQFGFALDFSNLSSLVEQGVAFSAAC